MELNLIPCEICDKNVPFDTYTEHMEECNNIINIFNNMRLRNAPMRQMRIGSNINASDMEFLNHIFGNILINQLNTENEEVIHIPESERNNVTKICENVCDESICSICFEKLKCENRPVRETNKCKHQYHEDCLFKWFDKSKSCPNCNSIIQ
jgi:hypothetical protein